MPELGPWYIDTVVLSNFALTDHVDVLANRYGTRAHVTHEVLAEVSEGIVAGYPALRAIEEAVIAGVPATADPLGPQERHVYRDLLRNLSSGEASCIAIAHSRGGVVVTEDRAARNCCADRGIPSTGTIGILKACCVDGTLEPTRADEVLSAMIQAGFYSPVQRVSDLL